MFILLLVFYPKGKVYGRNLGSFGVIVTFNSSFTQLFPFTYSNINLMVFIIIMAQSFIDKITMIFMIIKQDLTFFKVKLCSQKVYYKYHCNFINKWLGHNDDENHQIYVSIGVRKRLSKLLLNVTITPKLGRVTISNLSLRPPGNLVRCCSFLDAPGFKLAALAMCCRHILVLVLLLTPNFGVGAAFDAAFWCCWRSWCHIMVLLALLIPYFAPWLQIARHKIQTCQGSQLNCLLLLLDCITWYI